MVGGKLSEITASELVLVWLVGSLRTSEYCIDVIASDHVVMWLVGSSRTSDFCIDVVDGKFSDVLGSNFVLIWLSGNLLMSEQATLC